MITSKKTRRPRRGLLLAAILPSLLAGCASNPFQANYVGIMQESDVEMEADPIRLITKEDLRRLGTSRFEIDMVIGVIPGDEEAMETAREVGAVAYWWSSRPKYSSGNAAAKQQWKRGRVGTTDPGGMSNDEKTIKWYAYEAIFYADRPSE